MDSKQKKTKDNSNENIQVFVRVRPLNASEQRSKSITVVDTTNKDVVVNERPTDRITKTFSFDRVFDQESKQIEVYKAVVAPLIEEVLAGYNCTVFAYGQTGTGKTFTMEGDRSGDPGVSWDNDPSSGIVPRTLSHLFDELRIIQAEFTVRVSFLELYNEELFDLLSPLDELSKLKLYEDVNKKGSVIVHGLEEIPVHSKNEVYKIMEKGSFKRQTASTLMNAKSSRSHTIFSIIVHIKENSLDGEELLKTGKLNLVDLAGSENVGRSGAIDKRAREAGNINQSLLTLGRCIKSLVERTPHIPYRESKLTRLLQDSLGGKTKTSIIATISPAGCSLEETLSTLDYAHRAKNITNRPEINQKLTKKTLIKEYTEEIDRLRRDLMATREGNGVCIAKENYQQMINELENLHTEMAEKIGNIKALSEELEKKEGVLRDLGMDLARCTKELTLTNKLLDKSRQRLHTTQVQLKDTEQECDEHSHLVEKHVKTETELGKQAHQLLAVAEESTSDTYKLHDKLCRKLVIEDKNSQVSNAFLVAFNGNMEKFVVNLEEYTRDQLECCKNDQVACGEHLSSGIVALNEKRKILSSLNESFGLFKQDMITNIAGQKEVNNDWQNNFLNTLTSHCTASCEGIDEFMKKISALLLAIDADLGKIQSVINTEAVALPQKLASHQQSIRKHCESQLSGIFVKLQETVEQIVDKGRIESEASLAKASQLQNMHEKLVADTQLTFQNWLNESTLIRNEIQSGLTQAVVNGKDIADTVAENMNQNKTDNGLFLHHIDESVNAVNKGFENLVIETSMNLADSQKNSELIKQDLSNEQILRKEEFSSEKTRVQELVHNQTNQLYLVLQDQVRLVEDTNNGMQVSTSALEKSLQDQGDELESYSRHCQASALKNADQVTEWSKIACIELQTRKQEVTKFVNSDLNKDIPTGVTPERKNFRYTRVLAATSPHQRIIERFRASRPCILDEFSTESDLATSDSQSECDQTLSIEEELKSLNVSRTSVLRRSQSTNDLQSLDSDNVLNISTISEREYPHENKENSTVKSCVPPIKTKKIGNSVSLNGASKSRVDSGLRKPLMAQNQPSSK